MIKFFLLTMLLTQQALAWEVIQSKKQFYLKDRNQTFMITSEGGTPRFLKVENWEGLRRVQYYAGAAGTSQICEVTRALLLNQEQKVLGDLPISYRCKSQSEDNLEQAQWILNNGVLEVRDPQTEELIKINIRQK